MDEDFKINKEYTQYEVSNLGRIRNIKTGRFLKPAIINKGYHSLMMHKDSINRHITLKLHRIVAETYLIKIPNFVIDHIDNNKNNNSSKNLQYVSNRYNIVKQKLYSEKGFIRVRNGVKGKTYTIEYRVPNYKRISYTSKKLLDCINYY